MKKIKSQPLVFDIETKNTFREVGAYEPTLLDISMVGIYDYATNEYCSFLENEFEKLWPFIEKASCLIGYNSNHFDIPLLNKYYSGDLLKMHSHDLLAIIRDTLGKSMKLDDVANATLGYGKTGDGLKAIDYYKEGKIDKLREYCLSDVKITKEIYDHGLLNKFIKYTTPLGIKELKINFKPNFPKQKINFTLPI
jgi:DEAD/DEAH box helicase domain-containing protein